MNELGAVTGAVKQDWEVFGVIFSHMEKQCEEYLDVVVKLRDKLAENDNALTLKSIEAAFQRKESMHKIGTQNRGAPLNAPVSLTNHQLFQLAASANTQPPGRPPRKPQRSKKWSERRSCKR